MDSFKFSLIFFVLVHVLIFSLSTFAVSDKEDDLLEGINSYRESLSLPALAKHGKANCMADELADDLEDQPCTTMNAGANAVPSTQNQLTNYPSLLYKCNIDPNTTIDGVVLPVCVPHLVPTLVLTNYTHDSQYAKYLNDSKFTGAGIGSEDDWTVLVLSTNTPTGSLSSDVSLVSQHDFCHYLLAFFVFGFSLFAL